MLSERPYRKRMSLGEAAAQLAWLAPAKLDADVVHALLVQLRRDAVAQTSMPRPWASAQERGPQAFCRWKRCGQHWPPRTLINCLRAEPSQPIAGG